MECLTEKCRQLAAKAPAAGSALQILIEVTDTAADPDKRTVFKCMSGPEAARAPKEVAQAITREIISTPVVESHRLSNIPSAPPSPPSLSRELHPSRPEVSFPKGTPVSMGALADLVKEAALAKAARMREEKSKGVERPLSLAKKPSAEALAALRGIKAMAAGLRRSKYSSRNRWQ